MFTLTALTIFIAHLEHFFFYTLSLPLLAVSTGMAHMQTSQSNNILNSEQNLTDRGHSKMVEFKMCRQYTLIVAKL